MRRIHHRRPRGCLHLSTSCLCSRHKTGWACPRCPCSAMSSWACNNPNSLSSTCHAPKCLPQMGLVWMALWVSAPVRLWVPWWASALTRASQAPPTPAVVSAGAPVAPTAALAMVLGYCYLCTTPLSTHQHNLPRWLRTKQWASPNCRADTFRTDLQHLQTISSSHRSQSLAGWSCSVLGSRLGLVLAGGPMSWLGRELAETYQSDTNSPNKNRSGSPTPRTNDWTSFSRVASKCHTRQCRPALPSSSSGHRRHPHPLTRLFSPHSALSATRRHPGWALQKATHTSQKIPPHRPSPHQQPQGAQERKPMPTSSTASPAELCESYLLGGTMLSQLPDRAKMA